MVHSCEGEGRGIVLMVVMSRDVKKHLVAVDDSEEEVLRRLNALGR